MLSIEAQIAVRLYPVSQLNASGRYNCSRCIGCPQTTLINTVLQSTYQITVLVTKSSERILLYDITQNRFTAEGLQRPTLTLFGRTFIHCSTTTFNTLIHTGNYIHHLVQHSKAAYFDHTVNLCTIGILNSDYFPTQISAAGFCK
jgi:hypothetical protein